jgi:hypothetical protein
MKYDTKLTVTMLATEALWLIFAACLLTAWLGCWPWK